MTYLEYRAMHDFLQYGKCRVSIGKPVSGYALIGMGIVKLHPLKNLLNHRYRTADTKFFSSIKFQYDFLNVNISVHHQIPGAKTIWSSQLLACDIHRWSYKMLPPPINAKRKT